MGEGFYTCDTALIKIYQIKYSTLNKKVKSCNYYETLLTFFAKKNITIQVRSKSIDLWRRIYSRGRSNVLFDRAYKAHTFFWEWISYNPAESSYNNAQVIFI